MLSTGCHQDGIVFLFLRRARAVRMAPKRGLATAHVAVGSPEPPPASGSLCREPARRVCGEAKGPVGPEAGWPHLTARFPRVFSASLTTAWVSVSADVKLCPNVLMS